LIKFKLKICNKNQGADIFTNDVKHSTNERLFPSVDPSNGCITHKDVSQVALSITDYTALLLHQDFQMLGSTLGHYFIPLRKSQGS
jgi:hypothetical protein